MSLEKQVPVLSLAVPTYNRCDLLLFNLRRHIELFRGFPHPYEIVVSDNQSDDATCAEVGELSKSEPCVRLFRRDRKGTALDNIKNAYRKCTGRISLYVADDDLIDPVPLAHHVETMLAQDGMAGVFTDHIAFDDENGSELHRYFTFVDEREIEVAQPANLLDFVLENRVFPEIGVFRTQAIQTAMVGLGQQYPWIEWLFNLNCVGSIRFSTDAFYRECRVLKKQFNRGGHWANMALGLQYVGEELRLALENFIAQAMVSSGAGALTPEQKARYHGLIETWLHSRLGLEIQRAVQRRDFILGVELKRKWVVWHGIGSEAERQADLRQLTLPATLQEIRNLFLAVSGISQVAFHGLADTQYAAQFAALYPEVPVTSIADMARVDPSAHLLVTRDPTHPDLLEVYRAFPGHLVDLRGLLNAFLIGYSEIHI